MLFRRVSYCHYYCIYLQAYSSEGHISVAGIDGKFELLADKGTIRLQINKLYKDSSSIATATKGHIVASVDPEVS